MIRRRIPQRGDVYWINPNPVAAREMKNRHRFVVVTTDEIVLRVISVIDPAP
jgi:mRNA interferase ChpB